MLIEHTNLLNTDKCIDTLLYAYAAHVHQGIIQTYLLKTQQIFQIQRAYLALALFH